MAQLLRLRRRAARRFRKRFTGRELSLFVVWVAAEFAFVLHLAPTLSVPQLVGIVLYLTFTPTLLAAVGAKALVLSWVARRRGDVGADPMESLVELLAMDLPGSAVPLIFGGLTAAGLLGAAFAIRGVSFGAPSTDDVLVQILLVAPNETFAFLLLIPALLPRTVFGMPGWAWAQVMFGSFHYVAYALAPFAIVFAIAIGLVWYQIKEAGKAHAVFGLAWVLAFHAVWNILSGSAGAPATGEALTAALGIAGVPAAWFVGGLVRARTFGDPSPAVTAKTEHVLTGFKRAPSNGVPRGSGHRQGLVLPRLHGRDGRRDRASEDGRQDLRARAPRAARLRVGRPGSEGAGNPRGHGGVTS